MTHRSKQRGITIWGLMIASAVLIFFIVLGIKLFFPYMEQFKISTALKNVAAQPNTYNMTRGEIKDALDRRFSIDGVTNVNLEKQLVLDKKPTHLTIRLDYEVAIEYTPEIWILLKYKNSAQVNAR